ncbi:MAG: histidine phosphatase family protein [Acidimicrobiia bacterium]|nr:histidine phosphatase family protein [Acidimicrobiia bacterium]
MTAADNTGDQSRSYPQGFFTPAPDASQVLLIRHGQSEPYVPGRPFRLVDGHGDPELTELGHFQARRVADRLVTEPVSAIYVSTLTRTHQTASPLAEATGIKPIIEPELREVYLGEAEGGLLREMFATDHPTARALRTHQDWGVIPGAESNAQLTERAVGAVDRIADRHRGEMVAAFCHGGVIAAVLQHVSGSGPGTFFGVRHTSINHLVIQTSFDPSSDDGTGEGGLGAGGTTERQWIIRSFNDGAHAGGLTGDHLPDA